MIQFSIGSGGCRPLRALLLLLLQPFLVRTLKQETVKSLDAFQRDCLDAHNTYRSQHGVPPLTWSEDLTEHAQNWADQLASRDEIKHDLVAMNKNAEGENLAFFRPAVPKCQGSMVGNCVLCREMIKRWYDEVKSYDYDTGHSKIPEGITKHFSQIIWANTSEVGIGTAVSKKFGFVTVARYRPQGNKGGPAMFVLNVPPEGGPLPSLFNDSPKAEPKSPASTTPTGNGVPITDSTTNNPPKTEATKGSSISDAPSVSSTKNTPITASRGSDNPRESNTEKAPNTVAGSLDGSTMERIQTKPLGQTMNDEPAKNRPPFKPQSILRMIVDLANKTKQASKTKAADNTDQANQDGSQKQKAAQDEQEESILENHVNSDFSYENADSMYRGMVNNRDSVHVDGQGNNGKDSSTKSAMAGSQNNGNDGNDVNTKGDTSAKAQESSDSDTPNKQNLSRKNDKLDDEYRMEENGGEGVPQGNMDNKDNMTNKQQTTGPNIHTDDGQIDIQKDLKNSGLVRTVKGPDGSTAQVYLTKNGAHAGLVFRDQISRVSQEMIKSDESLEYGSKRVINVL